jgi:GNAT superfamily N-acetyltransferase
MKVTVANQKNLQVVGKLLSAARDWHLATTPEVWPVFPLEAISRDIAEERVYLFSIDSIYVATVTITETDPLIWDGSEDPAFYIHKLATRRDYAGQGLGATILEWIKGHALRSQKKFLRLDTWATNARLKKYYEKQGFAHIRTKSFPVDSPLPDHYRGASMNLFEMALVEDVLYQMRRELSYGL